MYKKKCFDIHNNVVNYTPEITSLFKLEKLPFVLLGMFEGMQFTMMTNGRSRRALPLVGGKCSPSLKVYNENNIAMPRKYFGFFELK